jgi:hypothetical protein
MSNIDNQHNVFPFVSGESKPLSGQRLLKVTYKPRNGKAAEYPSICVSVPPVPSEWVQDARFIPYFMEFLADTQDKVVKGLYESRKGQLERVSDAEIGPDALVSYLESQAYGDRISGDSISRWFSAYLQGNLMVTLADRLGYSESQELTQEQEDTLYREMGKFKAILLLIAGKEVSYSESQKKAISRMFDLASPDASESPLTAKMVEKFNSQCGKVKAEEVLDI